MWDKPRSSVGTGGFIRYAVKTCINHLKSCEHHPASVRDWARVEAESPRKQRYSPYGITRPGATIVPGVFPSGSQSSEMLPPSLPSTRFNSPALHLQMSALPSPAISTLPSPQLSALPSPLINTFPLSHGSHHPLLHFDQSPTASTSHSLHVEPATSHILQPAPPPVSWGDWPKELQMRFETHIARLTASAGLPLSWVDNLEWIDFVHQFLPAAKSPSRKVLTTRLIPHVAKNYRQIAKDSSRDQNTTIQADGWTGANFHHLLAFMISVRKKVRFTACHLEC